MYPVTGTSVVTVLALVLVFSSSLVVCCVCMRITGRRRYRPASRDELERAFFPAAAADAPQGQRPEPERRTSSSFIGQQLTESIRRKFQRRRQLLKAANCRAVPTSSPATGFHPADSVVTVDYRCHDNAAFWGQRHGGSEGGDGGAADAIGSSRATTADPSPPPSYRELDSGYAGIDPGYYLDAVVQQPPIPHQLLQTSAFIRSRETEL